MDAGYFPSLTAIDGMGLPASAKPRLAGQALMEGSLTGRSILIVEDEPFIVMDITQAFEDSGAELTTTNTLRHALLLVEHDGLSAAILDHALGDGKSSLLCVRLRERGIPFIIYSGYEKVEGRATYRQTSIPPGASCGG